MPDGHRCMKCDKQATHKITKIVDGKVHDIFLCDEHAAAFSPYLKQTQQHQAHLVELLQQILKQQQDLATTGETSQGADATCPNCGLNFSAYRKTLLLGCSDCYDAFADQLATDLRRMHGVASQNPEEDLIPDAEFAAPVADKASIEIKSDEQAAPVQVTERTESIDELKARMAKAIETEDFEEAARLRDSVRLLEEMRDNRKIDCARCGAAMEPRMGPKGPVLVCTDYPTCRNIRPLDEATGQ